MKLCRKKNSMGLNESSKNMMDIFKTTKIQLLKPAQEKQSKDIQFH